MIESDRQINLAFKKLQNTEFTSLNKQVYEEKGTVPFKLTSGDIWVGNIPNDPTPFKDNSSNIIKFINITLTKDESVSDSLCYKCIDEDGNQLSSFISPRFGNLYEISLYINETKIYTTDPCNWIFDYESGILTFSKTPIGDDSRIIRLEAFQYIGPTLNDGMTGIEYDSNFGHLLINYNN